MKKIFNIKYKWNQKHEHISYSSFSKIIKGWTVQDELTSLDKKFNKNDLTQAKELLNSIGVKTE